MLYIRCPEFAHFKMVVRTSLPSPHSMVIAPLIFFFLISLTLQNYTQVRRCCHSAVNLTYEIPDSNTQLQIQVLTSLLPIEHSDTVPGRKVDGSPNIWIPAIDTVIQMRISGFWPRTWFLSIWSSEGADERSLSFSLLSLLFCISFTLFPSRSS